MSKTVEIIKQMQNDEWVANSPEHAKALEWWKNNPEVYEREKGKLFLQKS